jgi:Acetoacetate decarboxylase (ADC)
MSAKGGDVETKELPPYISRDGELLAILPATMDTELYLFMLDADWDAIQAMCDRYLNLGGPTVYRPFAPFVMFYASAMNVHSLVDNIGSCAEKDFGFWVPVLAGKIDGAEFKAERFVTFTPYIWVDTGVPLVGGRTVYGFPKNIGKLSMPASTSDPAVFSISTQVLPRYSPESSVVERPLLECHKRDAGFWEELKQVWLGGENILLAIEEILKQHGPGRYPVPTVELLMQFLRDIGKELPMVYLKQFPDITDARKACYQAICEGPITITSGIQGGWLPGEYGIRIHNYESHQIVKNLGLKYAEQNGEEYLCKSLVHGWVKFQSTLQTGKVLWQTT